METRGRGRWRAIAVVAAAAAALFAWWWRSNGEDSSRTSTAEPAAAAERGTAPRSHAPMAPRPPAASPDGRDGGATAPYELTDIGGGVAVSLSGGPSSVYTMGFREPPPTDRTIRGRVATDAGEALEGAVVLADRTLWQMFQGELTARYGVRSGADGRYEVDVSSADDLAVIALRRDVGWSKVEYVPAGPGDVDLSLRIPVPGAVRGSVTYAGEPADAEAWLTGTGGNFRLTARTGTDGRFEIAVVPPGSYWLSVGLAQDIAGGSSKRVDQQIAVESGKSSEVEIELPVGVTVAAVVRYPDGFVPELMSYSFEPEEGAGPKPHFGTLYGGVDATNVIQYHDRPPGEYRLCAWMQKDHEDPGVVRCADVEVTPTPFVQEVELDFR